VRLFDAHNHLHDDRFGGRQEEHIASCRAVGVARMVVNGSCEQDWPQVAALARAHPDLVVPCFGYHPWHLQEQTSGWREQLGRTLAATPGAAVGEIGLDRWKPGLGYDGQEEAFIAQLELATELDVPASIHCLQAWGRMLDLLREGPRPAPGFILHSFGGPAEMVAPLAKLGAFFSLPGYFAHKRKVRQRETFRSVPPDRLLIETDAPDQLLPEELNAHPLSDSATGTPLNHPANLAAVYRFAADFLGCPLESLAARVEENFNRLFPSRQVPPAR